MLKPLGCLILLRTAKAMTAEEYDNLPEEIKTIVDSYDEDGDLYAECSRIQEELEQIGWTCDYYLDGIIYDVKSKQ